MSRSRAERRGAGGDPMEGAYAQLPWCVVAADAAGVGSDVGRRRRRHRGRARRGSRTPRLGLAAVSRSGAERLRAGGDPMEGAYAQLP